MLWELCGERVKSVFTYVLTVEACLSLCRNRLDRLLSCTRAATSTKSGRWRRSLHTGTWESTMVFIRRTRWPTQLPLTLLLLHASTLLVNVCCLALTVRVMLKRCASSPLPSPPLDNIWVMAIVWRLRGNIIRTALCWIVWHNVHSQQHTYVSSSYWSNRLGLSHWDPYAVRSGSCLELYYCNMVEWFWCDSSLIFDDQLVSFSALALLVLSSGL